MTLAAQVGKESFRDSDPTWPIARACRTLPYHYVMFLFFYGIESIQPLEMSLINMLGIRRAKVIILINRKQNRRKTSYIVAVLPGHSSVIIMLFPFHLI
jgi:hypothetical protein